MLNLHKLVTNENIRSKIKHLLKCNTYQEYETWKLEFNVEVEKENMYWALNFDKGCILEVIAELLNMEIIYGDTKFLYGNSKYSVRLDLWGFRCVEAHNMYNLPEYLLKGVMSAFNKTYREHSNYFIIDEKFQDTLSKFFLPVGDQTYQLSFSLKLYYTSNNSTFYIY